MKIRCISNVKPKLCLPVLVNLVAKTKPAVAVEPMKKQSELTCNRSMADGHTTANTVIADIISYDKPTETDEYSKVANDTSTTDAVCVCELEPVTEEKSDTSSADAVCVCETEPVTEGKCDTSSADAVSVCETESVAEEKRDTSAADAVCVCETEPVTEEKSDTSSADAVCVCETEPVTEEKCDTSAADAVSVCETGPVTEEKCDTSAADADSVCETGPVTEEKCDTSAADADSVCETVEVISRDDKIDHTLTASIDDTENSDVSSTDADVTLSSIFREDIYEEDYGDMVITPRIEKMATTKKKNFNKTTGKKASVGKEKNNSTSNSIIEQHFANNGFIIIESSASQTIAGLKSLTYDIGKNFSFTAPLLKAARKAVCAPNAKGERILHYTIDKKIKAFYQQFISKLKQYGVFSKCEINGNSLTATISPVPRVINYLTGQWLEMYSAYVLEDVVSEYAKTYGYKYEILMNVKVSNIKSGGKCTHEIDCVISVDDKCFAFEMKSGQFDDYCELYNTRKELHFVPDRYLLLSTSLNDEVAETLKYFYEFYITNMDGFRSSIIEMLNKAFIK